MFIETGGLQIQLRLEREENFLALRARSTKASGGAINISCLMARSRLRRDMCAKFGFSLEIVIDSDPRKISYCKNLWPAVRLAGFIKTTNALIH